MESNEQPSEPMDLDAETVTKSGTVSDAIKEDNNKLPAIDAEILPDSKTVSSNKVENNQIGVNVHNLPAIAESADGQTPHPNVNITNQEKTPVSLLQEALSRRGLTPSYELMQIEGAVHEPTFRYRVSFIDKDALGVGKSKKEAKQASARALIEKLAKEVDFRSDFADVVVDLQSTLNESHGNAPTCSMDTLNDSGANEEAGCDLVGNPIGCLQEQCTAHRWPPPVYETVQEVGLQHLREFTIACVVANMREIGHGKSKKIAKRLAAMKMLNHVIEISKQVTASASAGASDAGAADAQLGAEAAGLGAPRNDETRTHRSTNVRVANFHRSLKSVASPAIEQLHGTCLAYDMIDYQAKLQAICDENNVEITYIDVEEPTSSGKHQVLLQITTTPVSMIPGIGATIVEAHQDAARSALQFLQIMTVPPKT